MSIFSWFAGLFSEESAGMGTGTGTDPIINEVNGSTINPANGLPMVGGEGGVDIEGNPFGTDFSHDSMDSDFDHSFGSSFDDSFSGGGSFNDW